MFKHTGGFGTHYIMKELCGCVVSLTICVVGCMYK